MNQQDELKKIIESIFLSSTIAVWVTNRRKRLNLKSFEFVVSNQIVYPVLMTYLLPRTYGFLVGQHTGYYSFFSSSNEKKKVWLSPEVVINIASYLGEFGGATTKEIGNFYLNYQKNREIEMDIFYQTNVRKRKSNVVENEVRQSKFQL